MPISIAPDLTSAVDGNLTAYFGGGQTTGIYYASAAPVSGVGIRYTDDGFGATPFTLDPLGVWFQTTVGITPIFRGVQFMVDLADYYDTALYNDSLEVGFSLLFGDPLNKTNTYSVSMYSVPDTFTPGVPNYWSSVSPTDRIYQDSGAATGGTTLDEITGTANTIAGRRFLMVQVGVAQSQMVGDLRVTIPDGILGIRCAGVRSYAVLIPSTRPIESSGDIPSHIEERLPECISFGSSGGPGFKTSIFESDSGYVGGNIEWEKQRAEYTVVLEERPEEEIQEFLEFFHVVRGQATSFRFKDWLDYQITNQDTWTGDGSTQVFQTFKRYVSGDYHFDRTIYKIAQGTEPSIQIDGVDQTYGVDFSVDFNTGLVTFTSAPSNGAVITIVSMEFDVPVRFAQDEIIAQNVNFRMGNVAEINLIEVRQ